MRKTILTISLAVRNKRDIEEVEALEPERKKTKFTQADVYLMGLRRMNEMLKKAKDIVKG